MRATFAVAFTLSVLSCSRPGDENLGLLTKAPSRSVDPAHLGQPTELVRAASIPGRSVDQILGAHKLDVSSKLQIEISGKPAETLENTYELSLDGQGASHLSHNDSH